MYLDVTLGVSVCELCALKCLYELTMCLHRFLVCTNWTYGLGLPYKYVLASFIPNPVWWCRMVFKIDDFDYLPFWLAAWNAVIF